MGYAITVSQPGYMPNVCIHAWTRRDAESTAVYEADIFREDWDANYRVEGSARSGRYDVEDLDASEHHLGWVIIIDEVPLCDFAPVCKCGLDTEPTTNGPVCSECGRDVRD